MRGNGGAEGNRTPDLRIANATLSHLSYSPTTGRRAGEAASAWEPWCRSPRKPAASGRIMWTSRGPVKRPERPARSEEHTSELQSLMRISYAVFCLKKKNQTLTLTHSTTPVDSEQN